MRSRPYGVNAEELSFITPSRTSRPSRQASDSMSVRPVRCRASSRTSSTVLMLSYSLTSVAFLGFRGSDREVSAVDGDAGAGDVGRGVGTQEQGRSGAVLRCAGPSQRGVEADLDVH